MLKEAAQLRRHPLAALGLQAFKFLLSGLPSFAVAIPFNALLVERVGWPKWMAYALTLYLQVTVNFFICRRFVFAPSRSKSVWKQYIQFMGVVAVFRSVDWAVYTFVVSTTRIHYLIVQCANVVIFSLAKFLLSKRAIEGSAPQPRTKEAAP